MLTIDQFVCVCGIQNSRNNISVLSSQFNETYNNDYDDDDANDNNNILLVTITISKIRFDYLQGVHDSFGGWQS